MNKTINIKALRADYLAQTITPQQVMQNIRQQAAEYAEHKVWIHLLSEAEQAPYLERLATLDPAEAPLWGIPFAIKDNIDLAGIPTTAACEAFAYTPEHSAKVVELLISAGAIPVGKTNMDQFATGLNGTRSPWGACKNAFNGDYISGGSSSGSAVAVALGLACFSLGTDTAGSGRVPAAFNQLVGLKPTRGLLSSSGLVPACRSLDCITIFAHNADEANLVLAQCEGFDARDAYSRANPFPNQSRQFGERAGALRIGVLPAKQLKFFGDTAYAAAYELALNHLREAGHELLEIDYTPFDEAARLLYEGPWVAERYLATQPLIDEQPEALFPVVRDIIKQGIAPKATALFKAQYRLAALKQICDAQLAKLDCLLTPTAGTCFTIDDMQADPVAHNSELGYYTNFMNLLDMSAIAVPAGMASNGLPFGVSLVGQAFADRALLSIAKRLEPELAGSWREQKSDAGQVVVDTCYIDVLVCGAHLEGLPLNWQLQERGATLKQCTTTAPVYRMYALAGGPPFRPGLILDEAEGAAIEVEIWSVPAEHFGSFVAGIPAPLGIGKVRVADGSMVCGFICEPFGIAGAEEITHLGGWRAYMAGSS